MPHAKGAAAHNQVAFYCVLFPPPVLTIHDRRSLGAISVAMACSMSDTRFGDRLGKTACGDAPPDYHGGEQDGEWLPRDVGGRQSAGDSDRGPLREGEFANYLHTIILAGLPIHSWPTNVP